MASTNVVRFSRRRSLLKKACSPPPERRQFPCFSRQLDPESSEAAYPQLPALGDPSSIADRSPFALDPVLACMMSSPLFEALSLEQCNVIASVAREFQFSRSDTVFHENEPLRFVFVIASGRIKVTQLSRCGKEIILRVDGRGSVLDGLAPSRHGCHSLTARAIEPCLLLAWPIAAFEDFAERFPRLRRNATAIVAERLQILERRFRELATERVPQRLAKLILRLLAERGETGCNSPVGLSCEELAQMVGTTLFTVSRLLCEWTEQGILQPERKLIVVDNIAGLSAIAHDDAPPDIRLHAAYGTDI